MRSQKRLACVEELLTHYVGGDPVNAAVSTTLARLAMDRHIGDAANAAPLRLRPAECRNDGRGRGAKPAGSWILPRICRISRASLKPTGADRQSRETDNKEIRDDSPEDQFHRFLNRPARARTAAQSSHAWRN